MKIKGSYKIPLFLSHVFWSFKALSMIDEILVMKIIKLNYSNKSVIALKGKVHLKDENGMICKDRCDIVNLCNDILLRRLELGELGGTVLCYGIVSSEYGSLSQYSIHKFNAECLGIKYLSLFLYSYAKLNGDKVF